jgi:signal transduction histidine kinase
MRVYLSSGCPDFSLDKRHGLTVFEAKPGSLVAEADLYVWNYSPGIDLESEVLKRPSGQHLILADPKDLDSLAHLQNSACILLKPVNPLTLRAFAELAWKAWELRQQAHETNTLRFDRDTLLQYVLEVNLKLEEYDQERSNFLARALHDFRSPLTALHGYCGLLAEGKLGIVSPEQQELLGHMRRSTKRLARLVGGTLELLLQGRFDCQPKRVAGDIEETLNAALHDVYPFLQDKSIDLAVDLQAPNGMLLFEAEQLQQVFVNLLENSCKFTPRNGTIQIRGYSVYRNSEPGIQDPCSDAQERVPDAYQVDISDSGPGVPPHLEKKIFEQYASYSGANDRSGGGLGLAICRAIVTSHLGNIWATPSQDGGRFSFVIPLHPAEMASNSGDLRQMRSEHENVAWA